MNADEFQSFEDMELDFADQFDNEEQVTAPEFPKEGIYHAAAVNIDASNEKVPGAAFFVFEIITGNVLSQQGKTVRYVVWPPSPKAKSAETAQKQWMKTILQVMLAFGMRKRGEFPKIRVNQDFWNSMEGKQCMIRVTHKKQSRVTEGGNKIEYINAEIDKREDLIPMFDPSVVSVPYSEESATMGGYHKSDEQKVAEKAAEI